MSQWPHRAGISCSVKNLRAFEPWTKVAQSWWRSSGVDSSREGEKKPVVNYLLRHASYLNGEI